jgi:hypothetical protein
MPRAPHQNSRVRVTAPTRRRNTPGPASSWPPIHVRAGESDGLRLARDAVTGVTRLSSMRARKRLAPLVAALESPGPVATTASSPEWSARLHDPGLKR